MSDRRTAIASAAQPVLAHRLRLHSVSRHHARAAGRRCSSGWPVKPKAACPSAWAATSPSWSRRNSRPRSRAIRSSICARYAERRVNELHRPAAIIFPDGSAVAPPGTTMPRDMRFPVRSAAAMVAATAAADVARAGPPMARPASADGAADAAADAVRRSAPRSGDGADRAQRSSRGGGVGAAAHRTAARRRRDRHAARDRRPAVADWRHGGGHAGDLPAGAGAVARGRGCGAPVWRGRSLGARAGDRRRRSGGGRRRRSIAWPPIWRRGRRSWSRPIARGVSCWPTCRTS